MNKKTILCAVLFCLLAGLTDLNAQQVKCFVKFANKSQNPYSLGNPGAFLSTKSVARRQYYSTPYETSDLPVTPAYLTQVASVPSVTILYTTKWLNGVVVSIPATATVTALNAINAFSFVTSSARVNKYRLGKLEELSAAPVALVEQQSGLRPANTTTFNMGRSSWQNKQIQVDCLHEMGYRGQKMVIAVMDNGFSKVDINPVFDSLRNRGGILGTRDFVSGGTSVYEDPSHGTSVLSCMAAIRPGVIMGSAPMADYWLLRTEEGGAETLSEEYNWVRAAEFADSVGADILTTSLGYTTFDNAAQNHSYTTLNGKTAPMSIASTMAARKGMFVLNAAGNEGGGSWGFISVAGDADSICTVGAVDTLGVYAGFSGFGPTYDGRIKPDLVARGVNAWVSDENGFCLGANGTSFSTPIMAGGVACIWQKNRQLNNLQLLQNLKMTATNAGTPTNTIGWGRPVLCSISIGINENALASADISIYPNPFQSQVTINSTGITLKTIELRDVLGHILKQVTVTGTEEKLILSTADLASGIYFIRLNTVEGTVTKKIIKQ